MPRRYYRCSACPQKARSTRHRFEISPEITLEDGDSLIKYEKQEGLREAQSDTEQGPGPGPTARAGLALPIQEILQTTCCTARHLVRVHPSIYLT